MSDIKRVRFNGINHKEILDTLYDKNSSKPKPNKLVNINGVCHVCIGENIHNTDAEQPIEISYDSDIILTSDECAGITPPTVTPTPTITPTVTGC